MENQENAQTLETPYANLTPSLILDAIENTGYRCSGSLLALNSYENRVYQVGIDDADPIIAKFYRPNRWTDAAILEEHAFAHELMDAEISVIAPLRSDNGETLHSHDQYRFALFKRMGGRTLELDNLDHLEWMGRFLGRMHLIGECKPFQHRIQLNFDTYGKQPYEFLKNNGFIPAEIAHNFCRTVEELLLSIEEKFLDVGDVRYIRLHGDCHSGNVIWRDERPVLVDLDDCLMGPAMQDLWMLLSGSQADMKMQFHRIMDGYEEFREFDYKEFRLVEALRSLRMLHYAGWLAKRWNDPAFPLNFPWFNTARYWQDLMYQLQEQI